MKKVWAAYLLWFFLGIFGAHRFYLGHIGVGLAQLFTAGGAGIWWIIDVFLIPSRVEQANLKTRVTKLEKK
ncbi:TM2 domain-containing protein [candidate division WOR-3 bacterium]|nr:TM2 domain-containing protein [candidate division WOR-3 bacterium]